MKKLTSFTKLTTGEGMRIAFTYSEIDDNGALLGQNKKGNFVVMDAAIMEHIEAVEAFISANHLEEG